MNLSTFLSLAFLLVFISCNDLKQKNNASAYSDTSTQYTGPIIDMHIHAYREGNPMLGQTHPPTLRKKTYVGAKTADEHKTLTLSKFEEHNIVKAVVTDGQDWIDEASDLILIGNAHDGIEDLKRQHAEGQLHAIAEMAPFYAGIRADDPSQDPYFALAEELDIPVGVHIFPGGPNGGFHLMPQMLGGMRVYNADPLQLENVLAKYPNIRMYMMHGGWPYVNDVKALLYAHPNLYVDIAVVNWILPQVELDNYLKALIDAGFGDRIMYGSDQMVWPDIITVGIESVNHVEFLTMEQKEDIFFDNAATFLRLSEGEIAEIKSH